MMINIIDTILRLTSPALKRKADRRSHIENNLSNLRAYREKRNKPRFRSDTEIKYRRELSEHEKLDLEIERLRDIQDQIIN